MTEPVVRTPFAGNNRLQVTREEQAAIVKFLAALLPGMKYVKCYECGAFVQDFATHSKRIPHPTEARTRIEVHLCKDC